MATRDGGVRRSVFDVNDGGCSIQLDCNMPPTATGSDIFQPFCLSINENPKL